MAAGAIAEALDPPPNPGQGSWGGGGGSSRPPFETPPPPAGLFAGRVGDHLQGRSPPLVVTATSLCRPYPRLSSQTDAARLLRKHGPGPAAHPDRAGRGGGGKSMADGGTGGVRHIPNNPSSRLHAPLAQLSSSLATPPSASASPNNHWRINPSAFTLQKSTRMFFFWFNQYG